MAIANRFASIITATETTDDFGDALTVENPPVDVPVHFTERISTDPEGQSVKRARIRIPARYVVEAGNVIVVGTERWSVVDVITQRTPQEWSVVNCVRLGA